MWTGPYLRSAAAELGEGGFGRKIGLVWAGDPRHPNDAHRSIRLDDLALLLEVPDLAWYSLQMGPARDQLLSSRWRERVVDLAPRLTDFATSAAVVAALDLVVTVDTSMAHLVGALGCPGIVMLPFIDCDWRWLADGESSPWYPKPQAVSPRTAGRLAGGRRRDRRGDRA